jgi:hypothetical protein
LITAKSEDLKAINLKVLGAIKPKVLNRIAKIDYGHVLPEGGKT